MSDTALPDAEIPQPQAGNVEKLSDNDVQAIDELRDVYARLYLYP